MLYLAKRGNYDLNLTALPQYSSILLRIVILQRVVLCNSFITNKIIPHFCIVFHVSFIFVLHIKYTSIPLYQMLVGQLAQINNKFLR